MGRVMEPALLVVETRRILMAGLGVRSEGCSHVSYR